MTKRVTQYKNVYHNIPNTTCPDGLKKYFARYGRYIYRFTHHGTKYEGTYQTMKQAAIELDKKFISLGLYDRLQVLKRVVKDKREAA
jgi:hypothetical protein